MAFRDALKASVLGWVAGLAPAAAQTPASPAKIVSLTRAIEVAPDGSWTMSAHTETQVLQRSAIASLAQPAPTFSDTLQDVDVTEAFNRKADGRTLVVTPDAIITQLSPAARGAPMLTDLKQKVILYPNVEVGDVLSFTALTRSKPMLGGQFYFTVLFPVSVPIDNGVVTLSLPKAMAPIADSRELSAARKEDGDRVVYTVTYSNKDAGAPDAQAVAEFDRAPRFSVSTFQSYDDVAKAYAALSEPMMAVTPEIKAEADRITLNVSDRYEQARRLYAWVGGHVRYTAVELGEGAIVPHSAASVLRNAFGDCKDHAVLFGALLKAKGIDSKMALINGTDSYTIAAAPNLMPFNHIITWLPEFRLYADSTSAITPFGLLPRTEYGKQAVHIGDMGHALHRVPLSDANKNSDSYKLTIRMDDDGRIESESTSTGTGDFADPLRVMGAMLQGDNGKKIAQSLLEKSHMPGATGAVMAPPPDPSEDQYHLSSTYAPAAPLGPLAGGAAFVLGDNLQLLKPVSAVFFGPVLDNRYKDAAMVPCFGGHTADDETLEFPSTRHLLKLPEDMRFKSAHVSYSSHWSQTATSVSVHREFSASFDVPVCTGALRDEMQSAVRKVLADMSSTKVAVPRN